MWCTRWYLPLLILPFPKASPYFLVLYLVSVTLHVRPCLYCIILLVALFGSSCYWEPASTSFLLDRNPQLLNTSDPYVYKRGITVEPLVELVGNYTNRNHTSSNAGLPNSDGVRTIEVPTSTRPPFPLTHLYERCWCDYVTALLLADVLNPTFTKRKDEKATNTSVLFPPSGFFEPFDQKGWESASLVRHSRKIAPPAAPPAPTPTPTTEVKHAEVVVEEIPEKDKPVADQLEGSAWREKIRWRNLVSPMNKRWQSFGRGDKETAETPNAQMSAEGEVVETETSALMADKTEPAPASKEADPVDPAPMERDSSPPSSSFHPPIPFWRVWLRVWMKTVEFFHGTYDLSRHGIPVTVDFGRGRSS